MATNIKLKRSATQNATPSTSDLELGELALNTYDGKMYMKKTVSGTSSIVELTGTVAASSSAFAYESFKYTASSSQTTFTGSDADSKTLAYTAGQIQVYLNGVLLDATDYTASNGSSVVLGSGATSGDILMVLNYSGTNPFDYFKYTATNAQTSFSGNDANSESLVYTVGNITVHLNGVLLDASDYTATSGTSVVLGSGASSGDILVIHEFNETALTDVSNDTTPQLSGNLDVNGNDIVSVSNGDIDIKPHGSGNIVLDGHTWPNSDGSSGQFLKTNGSGTLSFDTVSSAADDLTTGDSAVSLATSAGNITIDAQGSDTDIIFKGTDSSSDITALTLDMSAGGSAFFSHDIVLVDDGKATFGAGSDLQIYHDGTHNYIDVTTSDQDLIIKGTDGGSDITAVTFDMSDAGKATFNNGIVSNAGVVVDNITIDGTEIDLSSGDLTLDVAGDIILDADGDNIYFDAGGTRVFSFSQVSSDVYLGSEVSDKDLLFRGNDGGSTITALTLDMSAAGKATFNNEVVSGSHISVGGSNNELRFYEGSNYVGFEAPALSADQIWVLPTADGSANQVIKTDGSGNLSFADAAATVSGLTDTTVSSAASGDYLRYNGSAWVNVASAGNPVVNTMTGDASDTTLTLSRAPLHENAVQVYWDGVYQTKDNWSVIGTTLTFDTGPPQDVKVEAVTGSQTNILYGNDVTVDKMTGDNSDTTLSLSVTPSNENHTNVYFDGVYQSKDNYTLSGTTITFSTAPPTGVLVEAVSNQNVAIGTATAIASSALTGLTEVTAADADHVMIYDASGSALKKALVSDLLQTGEEIADTVGAMVSSNTETGITVTYQDGDNTIDFALAAAQTSITSLLATDIKIGEDDQTKIDFETADEIHFYAANAEQVYIADGVFGPQTDADVDLGTSSVEFKDLFLDGTAHIDTLDVDANATIAGTLGVTGDITGTLATAAQTNITSLGTLTTLTVDDITINGSTISDSGALDITSGDDLTIDVVGDIHLDADGGDVTFKDGGTLIGKFTNSSSDFVITAGVQDKDILFKGDDGGSAITAMAIDMSEGGKVGIGETTPLGKLHVKEDDAGNISVNSNFDQIVIEDDAHSGMSIFSGTSSDGGIYFGDSGAGNRGQFKYKHGSDIFAFIAANGSDHALEIADEKVTAVHSANITKQNLTSSNNEVAWDAKAKANAYYATTQNTTFQDPSNAVHGAIISVEIAQGGTPYTVSWDTGANGYEFAASTAPTMTATANKTDIYTFRYNGSHWQEIGRVQNLAQT